jgi:hypothetical protein
VSTHDQFTTPSTRFERFTGWELQAFGTSLSSNEPLARRPGGIAAHSELLDELHLELDIREELGFTDPEVVRSQG